MIDTFTYGQILWGAILYILSNN
uniref:Uncharacterized protein n=1 Tax=Rhizophora mucronata TaxID=61149 RepID=A0A2P2NQ84_RHIMU